MVSVIKIGRLLIFYTNARFSIRCGKGFQNTPDMKDAHLIYISINKDLTEETDAPSFGFILESKFLALFDY